MKDRTSTIRLGILEILYQSTIEDDEEDDEWLENDVDDEEELSGVVTQDTKSQEGDEDAKASPTSIPPKPKRNKKRLEQDDNDNDKTNKATSSFPTRFVKASQTIVQQMQLNAQLIYQATQDDFIGRTLVASQKILQEFPKQLDRTLDLMWRILTWDWPPFGGGGDEGSRGGPPPAM
jgi:flagellum-specific peptidoglycan hydrolase FlgJ